ncbi:uncharacterized protein LOC132637530 [Lycium barbarum]|uniref:uncharacterized protein LOC132637530 n=1 Tax=Lycium barbarum TaxID=112863 RepID=UPI00293EF76F|nr:uncharacterized protein LOC132637530 [Lycium barbarum]
MKLIMQTSEDTRSFSTKKALLRDLARRELAGVSDVVVTGLDLPEGFKVPKFEMFNGPGNPKAHLRAYCDQLVGVRNNPALIMKLFSRSLTGEASEWFTAQDMRQWASWEDMVESFMERFHFNVEIVPDRYYLEKVKQKSTENNREYANRWRTKVARVQPPMSEEELVVVFIGSQETNFYDRMLLMSGRPLSELVKMEEAIEDGLKSRRIIRMVSKVIGQSTKGQARKKKENVENVSQTPSLKPKRKEEFQSPIEVYQSPPPNAYLPAQYNPVPVFYAQPNFQSPP